MEPGRPSAEEDQNYVGQHARPQASRNGQVKPPPDAAFLPLALELIEGHGWEPLLRAATATALANEQVAVLNTNSLGIAVCSCDLSDRTMLE